MALVTVNIWTGAPLLALWVGSRVQIHSQASMAGIAVVAVVLAILCFLLLRLLRVLGAQYDSLVGASPTVRTHISWLRSMRGERPEYGGVAPTVSMAERIAIVTVVIAFALFEVWFFLDLIDRPALGARRRADHAGSSRMKGAPWIHW